MHDDEIGLRIVRRGDLVRRPHSDVGHGSKALRQAGAHGMGSVRKDQLPGGSGHAVGMQRLAAAIIDDESLLPGT